MNKVIIIMHELECIDRWWYQWHHLSFNLDFMSSSLAILNHHLRMYVHWNKEDFIRRYGIVPLLQWCLYFDIIWVCWLNINCIIYWLNFKQYPLLSSAWCTYIWILNINYPQNAPRCHLFCYNHNTNPFLNR